MAFLFGGNIPNSIAGILADILVCVISATGTGYTSTVLPGYAHGDQVRMGMVLNRSFLSGGRQEEIALPDRQ